MTTYTLSFTVEYDGDPSSLLDTLTQLTEEFTDDGYGEDVYPINGDGDPCVAEVAPPKEKDDSIKIERQVENIDDEEISSLLCSAFEGGTGYWLRELDYELADGVSIDDIRRDPEDIDQYWHWTQLVPLEEGCRVTGHDIVDDKPVYVDRERIERGLQLMATKTPKHWADWRTQSGDAITGDVFLQLCIFGEVIYG